MSGPIFSAFIAIDWSGAVGSRHPGIAVAAAPPGDAAPALIAPPGRAWSRQGVLDWLLTLPGRPLIGFDFSFAPPFDPAAGYLPGEPAPATARDFWAWLDARCPDADLGAASFLRERRGRHFYFGAADGPKAPYMRLRACERAFNAAGGGKPSSVFDAIGAAQVAKASFAGMRLLHHLGDRFAIWPFDPPDPVRGIVVEIYTRAMLRHAGGPGRKLRDRATLDAALAALGSRPAADGGWLSDHATDALVSAAALRALAPHPRWWSPPGLTPALADTEGWTFGIG